MKIYSARLVDGSKSSYTIEFRHPVLRDNNGKQGRKIRRGLGTDKKLAETIVKYINEVFHLNKFIHSIDFNLYYLYNLI